MYVGRKRRRKKERERVGHTDRVKQRGTDRVWKIE
jgi:hypothetical protein